MKMMTPGFSQARVWAYVILAGLLFGFVQPVAAQVEVEPENRGLLYPLERRLTVDSGYFLGYPSNRALVRVGLDYFGAQALLFDYGMAGAYRVFGDNPLFMVLTYNVLLNLQSFLLVPPYTVALHEFAHVSRAVAAEADDVAVTHTSRDREHQNFFTYFAYGFAPPVQGGRASYSYDGDELPQDWPDVVTMGGVNAQTYFAEKLEEQMFFEGGHAAEAMGYLYNKIPVALYILAAPSDTGDIDETLSYYDEKGYGITEDELMITDFATLAVSPSTYAYLRGVFFGLGDAMTSGGRGQTTPFLVEPFYAGGFKLPDTAFYLNDVGLSLRVSSAYMFDTWTMPFAVEQVYRGDPETEVTVGAVLPLELGTLAAETRAQAFLNIEGVSLETSAGVAFTDFLRLDLGVSVLDRNTLHGQRNGTRAVTRYGTELWASTAYVY